MSPDNRRNWFSGRIRIGMIFLAIAILWRWFVHPGPHLSSGLSDAIAGVLLGISLGCLLTGLRANALRGAGRGQGPEGSAK